MQAVDPVGIPAKGSTESVWLVFAGRGKGSAFDGRAEFSGLGVNRGVRWPNIKVRA